MARASQIVAPKVIQILGSLLVHVLVHINENGQLAHASCPSKVEAPGIEY